MKKSLALTLALVFVLGIAGTAFAANPFADVPANHWAYGAVKNLAQAGLIDGMSDGTFQGDKEMTRYEMAQLVAKAMAKSDKADATNKALIEKLSAEFAAELDNLGVRVTNLEKKVGNVKFFGDVRMRYTNLDKAADQPSFAQRFRLNITAPVNETTTFNARYNVMNHNEFGTTGTSDKNQITVANMTTKGLFHNTDVMVGRYDLNLGQTTYFAGTAGMVDGIQATITSGKATLMGGYATINDIPSATTAFYGVDNIYYAEAGYAFSKDFKMNANYINNQDKNGIGDLIDVMGFGLNAKVAPNVKLLGDYWVNSGDDAQTTDGNDSKGYVARLAYKGANPAVPGTFGFGVEYLKIDPNAVDANVSGAQVKVSNVKGWDVQFNYTLAKNITFDGFYQFNMKNADGSDKTSDKYTRLQVNYMF